VECSSSSLHVIICAAFIVAAIKSSRIPYTLQAHHTQVTQSHYRHVTNSQQQQQPHLHTPSPPPVVELFILRHILLDAPHCPPHHHRRRVRPHRHHPSTPLRAPPPTPRHRKTHNACPANKHNAASEPRLWGCESEAVLQWGRCGWSCARGAAAAGLYEGVQGGGRCKVRGEAREEWMKLHIIANIQHSLHLTSTRRVYKLST
jgi:hypothetical protein